MHPLSRPGVSEENLKVFIGNNAEKIIRRGARDISWCWPAFFFSFLWLAYRKAYLAAFLVLVVEFCFQALDYYGVATGIAGFHFHYSILLVHFAVALFGLRYYLRFASKKVAKINAETADSSSRDTLYHAKGRTSAASVVGIMLLSMIINGGVLYTVGGPAAFHHLVVQSESTQTESAQVTTVTVQNANTSIHSVITTSTKANVKTAS
ncbi:MAG: group-specific protein [Gammaproteobacteria bacterium]|jgi:hypothetical protein|nr:group-specific protein [Gammaproteobacteria bacterium]